MELMEKGFETKDIVRKVYEQQEEIKQLEHSLATERERHEKEKKEQTKKLTEATKEIVRLNKEILQPMAKECNIKEELIKRLRTENERFSFDFKMVTSILKFPRLCTEFHKAVTRRYTKKKKM